MSMREEFEKWADANWMIVHSPDDAWGCWQAATIQAAERMKEEAVANARAALRHGKGYADVAEQAIRAIDVNKLFGE